jgi:hypothetical protein
VHFGCSLGVFKKAESLCAGNTYATFFLPLCCFDCGIHLVPLRVAIVYNIGGQSSVHLYFIIHNTDVQ